ncbi:hypothetical protein LEL_05201 [Akanthomyces lecanii RCEF 1005]|uniref:Duf1665 domain containing protein n=1 Tax=Akanthomyces lecanii RCEF 1005 TaxID=1081108 RepID=A0A162KQG8_CORDF|nr:hypothetical protein LEL_05201 [Akanthomyces lecanii RCEF 1005]
MFGTFGRSNPPSDRESQALKAFLVSAERSEEEVKSFMDANFANGIIESLIPSIFHEKAIDAYEAAGATVPRRPGFGLLLKVQTGDDEDGAFPRLSVDAEDEDSWRAHTLLIREVCMLRVVEELTNKPEWWLKVKDDVIAAKWKTEILQMDWRALVGLWAVFTEGMADAVIAELRAKADLYQETGLIPVMDYSACAIKSDRLMTDELVQRLKAAVAPLENVPANVKDWHPGSEGKVLDIVHPSLWPLVYGRTRVLPDKTIGVADCLKHAGTGVTLPTLEPRRDSDQHPARRVRARYRGDDIELSTRYQWLPCDVALKDGKATIASYINNVHPVRHASLYPVIEEFINLSLPAWDLVYRWPTEFEFKRMHWDEIYKWDCKAPDFCKGKCDPHRVPISEGGIPGPREDDDTAGSNDDDDDDDFDEDAYYGMQRGDAREQWFARHHTMILPDPNSAKYCDNFAASEIMPSSPGELFGSDGEDTPTLQVIVKLASIHLTPDKPSYAGGSWHVEGQRNEHIVATALFYYDSDNVTDSALAFRTAANGEELDSECFYEQGDMLGIERALAIRARGSVLQDVGRVSTRPGRALFFPNLYQHRVSPFTLADPTRPGHRKILALFLVDPKVPVLSTANVPPQQRDWWEQEVGGAGAGLGAGAMEEEIARRGLPNELRRMVMDGIDFPIALDEAKRIREDLMAERKVLVRDSQSKWDQTEFNFCEH